MSAFAADSRLVDVLMRRVRVHSCVYCGGVTKGSPLACPGHNDLLAVDPNYRLSRRFTSRPEPAGPLAGRTAGSDTIGG